MKYKMTIHDAKDKLPLKSGTYLVKTSKHFNLWQVLPYSTKFKKFNTYDSQDNDKDAVNGYMWAELPGEDLEVERVTCPDCKGRGVWQEYNGYDRYYVYACHKCEGTGKITRQSVTEEACKYCDGKEKPLANNHSGYALEIKGSELSVWEDLQCLEIFKINFCPNCGRKFKENE